MLGVRYLLDSNVFREVGKSEPHENVSKWLSSVPDTDLAISVLSIREARRGISKLAAMKPAIAAQISSRLDLAIHAFDNRVIGVDAPIATAWGEMLGRSNKHVDDTGLAATAIVHGLVLVTRNVDDFVGRGVFVLDPYSKSSKVMQK